MPDMRERARRRESAIQRFAVRQRTTSDGAAQAVKSDRPSLGLAYRRRSWVSIADLADWCAAATTTAGVDEQKKARNLALDSLAKSIRKGEFEHDGKSKVLFMAPYIPGDNLRARCRLTKDQFEYILQLDSVPLEMLAQLWLPRDLAQSWLESHGYPRDPHFDPTRQSRPEPRPQPTEPLRSGLTAWSNGADAAPGPKGGETSIGRAAWSIAERILAGNERPKRGHGRLAKLARLVADELERAGQRRQPDSICKVIGPSLREWEAKHPEL
jgi:hypothetical protein